MASIRKYKGPDINVPEVELENSGFTPSGKERFKMSVKVYSEALFKISIARGDVDKDRKREITHEHVKAAEKSLGKSTVPKYLWAVRVGQYLCTALTGVTVSYLNEISGAIGFAVAFAIGLILFYIETIKTK